MQLALSLPNGYIFLTQYIAVRVQRKKIIGRGTSCNCPGDAMKKIIAFGVLIAISCSFQRKTTEFYDKQFKWKIAVPANFEQMSDAQIQNHTIAGSNAISKTTGTEFENQGEIICIFQNTVKNTFTASYKSFDIKTDGSLSEICQNTKELICETYLAQLKSLKIDTSSSMEIIDSLAFNVVKIITHLPNQKTSTMLFYERIFNDKLFSFNIIYVDEKIGAEITEAWKKSKFNRG
jgi:hypothetical protein